MPKLLDALATVTNLREAGYLHRYGSYLLVRDGLENPEAVRQLDRMLSHEDRVIRSITAYAFGRHGHPFGEDSAPSEEAVEFGLPRLLLLAKDPDQSARLAPVEVLGDLAHHHPKSAPEVMPVLVGMLEQGTVGYVNNAIKKIVEVNPDAARAFIPQLRRLLEDAGDGTAAAQLNETMHEPYRNEHILQSLCDVARSDPEMAHEVAVDYVGHRCDSFCGVPSGGGRFARDWCPCGFRDVPMVEYSMVHVVTSCVRLPPLAIPIHD